MKTNLYSNIKSVDTFEERLFLVLNDTSLDVLYKQEHFTKLFNLKKYEGLITAFLSDADKVVKLFNPINYSNLMGRHFKIKTAKKFIELLDFEKKNLNSNFLSTLLVLFLKTHFTASTMVLNFKEQSDVLSYLLFNKKFPLEKEIGENLITEKGYYGGFYLELPKHKNLFNLIVKKLNVDYGKKGDLAFTHILRSYFSEINATSITHILKNKKIAKIVDISEVEKNIYYQQIQNEILYNFIETYISNNYCPSDKNDLLSIIINNQIKFYNSKDFFSSDKFLNEKPEFFRKIINNKSTIDKINEIIDFCIKNQGSHDFCENLLLKELFRSGLYDLFISFLNTHYATNHIKEIFNTLNSNKFIENLNNNSPLFGQLAEYKKEQNNILAYLEKLSINQAIPLNKNKIVVRKI